MKKSILLTTSIIGSLVSLNLMAESFNYKSVKIELHPNESLMEVSAIVGVTSLVTEFGHAVNIPAELVIEGEKETLKIKANVLVPTSVGASIGYAGLINNQMHLKNIDGKTVSEIFGKYSGLRTGIAATIFGVSYYSAKNENGVKLTDWDYRYGIKVDVATIEKLYIAPVDSDYSDLILQKI